MTHEFHPALTSGLRAFYNVAAVCHVPVDWLFEWAFTACEEEFCPLLRAIVAEHERREREARK